MTNIDWIVNNINNIKEKHIFELKKATNSTDSSTPLTHIKTLKYSRVEAITNTIEMFTIREHFFFNAAIFFVTKSMFCDDKSSKNIETPTPK